MPSGWVAHQGRRCGQDARRFSSCGVDVLGDERKQVNRLTGLLVFYGHDQLR